MAGPKSSRRLLGGALLLAGVALALGSLLVLARELMGETGEPMALETIAAAAVGVLLGLVVMGVGAMLGR